MENFEEILRKDLHQFLLSMKEVDERLPECPDVEDKWEEIAKAYIPDGIREFQDYPSASLGWMMYIGMAVAIIMFFTSLIHVVCEMAPYLLLGFFIAGVLHVFVPQKFYANYLLRNNKQLK